MLRLADSNDRGLPIYERSNMTYLEERVPARCWSVYNSAGRLQSRTATAKHAGLLKYNVSSPRATGQVLCDVV
jgi:hypothetical protein